MYCTAQGVATPNDFGSQNDLGQFRQDGFEISRQQHNFGEKYHGVIIEWHGHIKPLLDHSSISVGCFFSEARGVYTSLIKSNLYCTIHTDNTCGGLKKYYGGRI